MPDLYIATPHGTSAPFAPVPVATSAAAKTLLQVAIPSTTDARLWGWGIGFAGVAPADPAGVCECAICTASTLASVTSLTPDKYMNTFETASLAVGGAALSGYNATAEGTLTAYRPVDTQYVHPQTGYSVWFPADARPRIDVSSQIRIRTTFTVSINAIPWVVWEEPS
jgi:hypothetical protein